jgi:hypothetical protein
MVRNAMRGRASAAKNKDRGLIVAINFTGQLDGRDLD